MINNGLNMLYELLQIHRKINLCVVKGAASWSSSFGNMERDTLMDIGRVSAISTLLKVDNFKLEVEK